MSGGNSARLWVVSELYYPEETSTGYYLTGIAEGLAGDQSVAVLCSQPTYAGRGTRAPRHEVHRGVEIWRCTGTTFDKNNLVLRLVNLGTISLALFWNAVRRIRHGDVVAVTTNPPSLPFAMLLACRIRRAQMVLMIHDLYPNVLVASGLAGPSSPLVRFLAACQRALYRSVSRIVVLGRDARSLVERESAVPRERVVWIPNWADVDEIRPLQRANNALLVRLGIDRKFVVQYSGNMGRTHGLEAVIDAAERLQTQPSIHFLLIGDGARRAWIARRIETSGLRNVTLLPYQPRQDLALSLAACDVALVSFAPRMAGVSIPSRMYNILAAGRPIVAVADDDSELARVVQEEGVGWVVAPQSAEALSQLLLRVEREIEARQMMGPRARAAAEQKYTYDQAIESYRRTLAPLLTKRD